MLIDVVTIIVVIVVFMFVEWLRHNSYRNQLIEIKQMISSVPDTIQDFNNGLKDSVKSSVKRAKPPLPEDLDEFSEVLIKRLKKDWACSYDWNSAVHYYQIAQLAAVNGWQAEWAQEQNIYYVRLVRKGY